MTTRFALVTMTAGALSDLWVGDRIRAIQWTPAGDEYVAELELETCSDRLDLDRLTAAIDASLAGQRAFGQVGTADKPWNVTSRDWAEQIAAAYQELAEVTPS